MATIPNRHIRHPPAMTLSGSSTRRPNAPDQHQKKAGMVYIATGSETFRFDDF